MKVETDNRPVTVTLARASATLMQPAAALPPMTCVEADWGKDNRRAAEMSVLASIKIIVTERRDVRNGS